MLHFMKAREFACIDHGLARRDEFSTKDTWVWPHCS